MKKKSRAGFCLIFILCIIFPVQEAVGQQKDTEDRAMVLNKVKTLLKEHDTFKAIEYINDQGEPQTVAKIYSKLVNDFYWKEKALTEVIVFSRAGIQYCLIKAQEIAKDDVEKAVQMKFMAKIISYNLASYTWPGWDEKGISISRSDLVIGLDAAKLNLRLAYELKKGAVPLSMAYWVLGAQYLALANYDEAIKAFISSKEKAIEGNDKMNDLLASGYIGGTKIIQGSQKVEGEKELDKAIKGFKELNTEDAEFYIEQLKTVLKIFAN
jgi:tetratricopeptide (TPR) repeat protein